MSVRPKNFNEFVKPNTFNMFEMNIYRGSYFGWGENRRMENINF